MSSTSSTDRFSMDLSSNTNHASSLSSNPRSKKLPPPPLRLPEIVNSKTEEKSKSVEQRATNPNSCSSSPSDDCSHQTVPLVLPTSQRAQILEILAKTSSNLLVPPPYENKQKKSSTNPNANPISFLRDRQIAPKGPVNDAEWLDFIRSLVQKSLTNELTSLLDKYKSTYFDRVNAPNTTDETIRSSLCAIIAEALSTYSSPTSLNESDVKDDSIKTDASPATQLTTSSNTTSFKRKRDQLNGTSSTSSTSSNGFNHQSKFVISYIIPGRSDHSNGNKTISPKHKKFQKTYCHLFKYIPDKELQVFLIDEGHLRPNAAASSRSPTPDHCCLMLHDEVLHHMDDQDRELSGISLDHAFTLPLPLFTRISSSNQ